jgi:hypothetical protein
LQQLQRLTLPHDLLKARHSILYISAE